MTGERAKNKTNPVGRERARTAKKSIFAERAKDSMNSTYRERAKQAREPRDQKRLMIQRSNGVAVAETRWAARGAWKYRRAAGSDIAPASSFTRKCAALEGGAETMRAGVRRVARERTHAFIRTLSRPLFNSQSEGRY